VTYRIERIVTSDIRGRGVERISVLILARAANAMPVSSRAIATSGIIAARNAHQRNIFISAHNISRYRA